MAKLTTTLWPLLKNEQKRTEVMFQTMFNFPMKSHPLFSYLENVFGWRYENFANATQISCSIRSLWIKYTLGSVKSYTTNNGYAKQCIPLTSATTWILIVNFNCVLHFGKWRNVTMCTMLCIPSRRWTHRPCAQHRKIDSSKKRFNIKTHNKITKIVW